MYLTIEAITSLNRALHLPATGREQDWDIELEDMNRVGEFIGYLADHPLNDDEKRALMALIVSSLEDLSYEKTQSLRISGSRSNATLRQIRPSMPIWSHNGPRRRTTVSLFRPWCDLWRARTAERA
jgi:hypothetical protein